jgi:hypothetical protein
LILFPWIDTPVKKTSLTLGIWRGDQIGNNDRNKRNKKPWALLCRKASDSFGEKFATHSKITGILRKNVGNAFN